MKKKRYLPAAVLCLILALGMSAAAFGLKEEKRHPVIGILLWKDGSELSERVKEYVDRMENFLDADLRVLEIWGENDLLDMTEEFCREGDVLINVVSSEFTDILRICEEHQVYLLQMWEMSMDTDILEKAANHRYYLGSMLSDDADAGRKMVDALEKQGCRDISILTYYWGDSLSDAQKRRNVSFQEALEPEGPAANLELYSFDGGIRHLARLDRTIDGLLLSERLSEYSVQEAKNIMNNPQMKVAYFDINEYTRGDLEEGSLVMNVCGQQNVAELAVAYAYAFVENGKSWKEKIDLACPYLYLTSAEEFDLYQELCVKESAYSEEMMVRLIDSLGKTGIY